MDYPFPGPTTSPVIEGGAILVLVLLSLTPLWRLGLRRRQTPDRRDALTAGIGLLLAGCAYGTFPFWQGGVPHPGAEAMQGVTIAVVTILASWGFICVLTSAVRRENRSLLPEVAGPYAVAVMVLCSGVAYRPPNVRPAAMRTHCRNQLKQILLALHHYHDDHRHFPYLATIGSEPPRSWRVDLLPYLDHPQLRQEYRNNSTWNSPGNLLVAKQNVPVYHCPSNPFGRTTDGFYTTNYFGIIGTNTMFPGGRGLRLPDLSDGSSQTIAIVEACPTEVVWSEPRDIEMNKQVVGVNRPGGSPGTSRSVIAGYHQRGANVAFADGSARFLSQDIDPQVLRALLTATGGETVGDY